MCGCTCVCACACVCHRLYHTIPHVSLAWRPRFLVAWSSCRATSAGRSLVHGRAPPYDRTLLLVLVSCCVAMWQTCCTSDASIDDSNMVATAGYMCNVDRHGLVGQTLSARIVNEHGNVRCHTTWQAMIGRGLVLEITCVSLVCGYVFPLSAWTHLPSGASLDMLPCFHIPSFQHVRRFAVTA